MLPSPQKQVRNQRRQPGTTPGGRQTQIVSFPSTSQSLKYSSNRQQNSIRVGDLYLLTKGGSWTCLTSLLGPRLLGCVSHTHGHILKRWWMGSYEVSETGSSLLCRMMLKRTCWSAMVEPRAYRQQGKKKVLLRCRKHRCFIQIYTVVSAWAQFNTIQQSLWESTWSMCRLLNPAISSRQCCGLIPASD